MGSILSLDSCYPEVEHVDGNVDGIGSAKKVYIEAHLSDEEDDKPRKGMAEKQEQLERDREALKSIKWTSPAPKSKLVSTDERGETKNTAVQRETIRARKTPTRVASPPSATDLFADMTPTIRAPKTLDLTGSTATSPASKLHFDVDNDEDTPAGWD